MKLLVDYKGRKFGTGGGVPAYSMTLRHLAPQNSNEGFVEIRADFDTPIEGHADDSITSSKAIVIGADILMGLREAEEFAKALLHSVEHARRVNKGQVFKFRYEAKA